MIEAGLQRFFMTFGDFARYLLDQKFGLVNENDDEVQPLTVQQLKRPLLLMLSLLGAATLMFIVEIVVH